MDFAPLLTREDSIRRPHPALRATFPAKRGSHLINQVGVMVSSQVWTSAPSGWSFT